MFRKSDAALFVAGQLGWPWKAVRVAARLADGAPRLRCTTSSLETGIACSAVTNSA